MTRYHATPLRMTPDLYEHQSHVRHEPSIAKLGDSATLLVNGLVRDYITALLGTLHPRII